MTIEMLQGTMPETRVNAITEFMNETSANTVRLAKALEGYEEKLTFRICGASVNPGEIPEVHLLAVSWQSAAKAVNAKCTVQSNYSSGPEVDQDWWDHVYRLEFTYGGCKYFCIMNGREIDYQMNPDMSSAIKEALSGGE